jgi:hypothetical protein
MSYHIVPETLEKAPPEPSVLAPRSQRNHRVSIVCASWCFLRHWWPTLSHRPPEMHAIDYLARDHPRAYV